MEVTICDLQFDCQNGPAPPFAFTENGVAMLSSVLNSDRAIAVNIQIMRTFTPLRQLIADNQTLARRLDDLAYGTGLWAGALRARSPRALVPAFRGITGISSRRGTA